MTTVVLTRTHIAQDHNIVRQYHPHKTELNHKHKKIFIPPHRRFILGCCGSYRANEIDCDKGYAFIETLLKAAFEDFTKFKLGGAIIKNLPMFQQYIRIFEEGEGGKNIMVTKRHRLIFYCLLKQQTIFIKPVGPIIAVGSGGATAVGLLEGGVPLEFIWDILHRQDPLTSSAHTIIPLSTLVDWDGVS